MFVAQQAHARRVEGRHPHAARVVTHEGARALAHFGRRLVREGDRQDLPSPRAARGQQVGDAVREHARLTGACTSQDQQRRARVSDGLALTIVEAARQRLGVHARARGTLPAGRKSTRGRGRLPRRRRTRCPARHGDLRPRVGTQGVLHIKGGHLRRHVVVLGTPVGADQETKVRQRSRVTHRLQG